MHVNASGVLQPPFDAPARSVREWLSLPSGDGVTHYLTLNRLVAVGAPASWEVARLSQATYAYRETSTGSTSVAKFYVLKTGALAEQSAGLEYEAIRRARVGELAGGAIRAVSPLGAWRGVLYLEFVEGATLENRIAAGRGCIEGLRNDLDLLAQFLARLHWSGASPRARPDFEPAVLYAHKIVDTLAQSDPLQHDPLLAAELAALIDSWAGKPAMRAFTPVFIHGDATTGNFIFPSRSGLIALDWERAAFADPAADLGRLMAELSHSARRYGRSAAEGESLGHHLAEAYCRASPAWRDTASLVARAGFYRAVSLLRIARNRWVPVSRRRELIEQATALLT